MKPSPKQLEALRIVAARRYYPDLVEEGDGWYARWRAFSDENDWVDAFVRRAVVTRLTEDAEDQRHETIHDAWLAALTSRTGLVRWDAAECAAFAAELKAWHGGGAEDIACRRAIRFTLRPAKAADGAFTLVTSIPSGRRAFRALGEAAYVYGPLAGLRRVGKGLALSLTASDAAHFLTHGRPALLDAGYAVDEIDFAAPVTADADVTAAPPARKGGPLPPPIVSLVVRVAGKAVTADEIRFLLDQGSSLVYFRDHWIEVDRGILREALRALEKVDVRKANPIAFALGIGALGHLEIASLKTHGWLRGVVNTLRQRRAEAGTADATPPAASAPIPGFVGTLRAYQRRGVAWLAFLTRHGFGALLADDMGLGKTVQAIAWMLSERAAAKETRPFLVVAPLTLLANWKRECAAFAPTAAVYVHQGDTRHVDVGFARVARASALVVTSYNLVVRDYAMFSEVVWAGIVLDEAQIVKNPDSRAARALRALLPPRRVALTGTPVENGVTDIWALEDFLNPGFLGDRKSFQERFAKPLALDGNAAAGVRLRRALEPFVLRRAKDDPAIASELGPKREVREYCVLTDEARCDYEAALRDFKASEHRTGDVFALITRLKLICDGAGKVARLLDLVEAIFAAGESVLVFTQYAKVGLELKAALEQRFSRSFPFLHGALSPQAREREIAAFNAGGPSAFILSLKAGGFGLNLTKATHVIHFDRWWNPAVENQATDRAHRIGQSRAVLVHVFVTAGTVEERIEEILARKARVAGAVITAEDWLEAAGLGGVA